MKTAKRFREDDLKRLLSSITGDESQQILDATFRSLCQAVDTPKALAAWILYENREFAQLVSLECDPLHYLTSYKFADDYLIAKFLSKFPDFRHIDLDPVARAKASFKEWEVACRLTNERFRSLDLDPSLWDPSLHAIFSAARRKIRSILRKPNLHAISEKFGWGPGVTTSTSGPETSAYAKFGNRLDVTSNSLIMGHCCVNSTPSWINCQLQTDEFPSCEVSLIREAFNVVRGNEIVFVPKNAKTHRVIAKEPHVNSYLQKGFGGEIRSLLKRYAGIDLNDQSVNQQFARVGSLTNSLATIDLSGASDTISYELVKFLLPEDWFILLDSCRSKQGLLDGSWLFYQKFSSMGNAFTFELESLIFYSLAKATVEVLGYEDRTCSVYGDDIIISSEAYSDVAKVIDFAGFTVNKSKSFFDGPFRESCGKDYYLGTDVRPIFLKESIASIESIFKLANSVRRYSHRRNINYGCDRRFLATWRNLFYRAPTSLRTCLIPDGFGDVGFVVNFDEACPLLIRPKGGWEGFKFNAVIRLPVKRKMRDTHRAYTAMLSAAGSEIPLLGHHDLRRMTRPKRTRLLANGWQDLGPWC